jgi:hypothetical protein
VTRSPPPLVRLALAAFVAAASVAGFRAAAADEATTPEEIARKESVERLEKAIKRMTASPRVAEKKDDIKKAVDALGELHGTDAAKASLAALAFDDEDVEKDVMKVVEADKGKALVAPLGAMIEDKDTRRRFRLHGLIARAFAVIGDASALEHLAKLVQSEDPHVVAAAADALVTFKKAPHAKRVEPVRRTLDVFESTWNYKESVRPEDRLRTDVARTNWEIYGTACRKALQALTGQTQLSRPQQFRDWWNEKKHANDW